jgi:hypothetical protein
MGILMAIPAVSLNKDFLIRPKAPIHGSKKGGKESSSLLRLGNPLPMLVQFIGSMEQENGQHDPCQTHPPAPELPPFEPAAPTAVKPIQLKCQKRQTHVEPIHPGTEPRIGELDHALDAHEQ